MGEEKKEKSAGTGEKIYERSNVLKDSVSAESYINMRGTLGSVNALGCVKCGSIFPCGQKCGNCEGIKHRLKMFSEGPGIICENCNFGYTTWNCPNCGCANQVKMSYLKEKSKGCFVATACTSPFSWQVTTLSMFRDYFLTSYPIGRLMISFYYKLSPRLARIISRNLAMKITVRNILITPIAYCVGQIMKLFIKR